MDLRLVWERRRHADHARVLVRAAAGSRPWNGFKNINDRHGHQAGDACLVRFAIALASSFRPNDTVVRYAGDEFLVIASGLDDATLDGRIRAVHARLRPTSAAELPIGFSYGVGHLPPGGNPDEALRAADEAMYRTKPGSGRRAAAN